MLLVVGWQCDFNRSWSAHVSHVEPQKRFKTALALAHDAIMDSDQPRRFYVGQERFTQGVSNKYFLDPSLWESGFSFETALQEASFWKRWYVGIMLNEVNHRFGIAVLCCVPFLLFYPCVRLCAKGFRRFG